MSLQKVFNVKNFLWDVLYVGIYCVELEHNSIGDMYWLPCEYSMAIVLCICTLWLVGAKHSYGKRPKYK